MIDIIVSARTDAAAAPLAPNRGISSRFTHKALTELGCVAYHGSVTLEELMRDNPAEQHQQEMGGLA